MEPELKSIHCATHDRFVNGCEVCQRARANFLPYPVRAQKPLPRSFGYTDQVTESKLRGPMGSGSSFSADSDAGQDSLSLIAIRLILRLIWPFGRIGP